MKKLKKNTFVRYVDGKPKTNEVRKESNDEILHRVTLTGESIRLRVQVQIKHPDTGSFVGWQGVSLKKEVSTIEEAREFVAQLTKLTEG